MFSGIPRGVHLLTMRFVAVEEHYLPEDGSGFSYLPAAVQGRMRPSVAKRLADMDAAGIEMQVLSGTEPITEVLPAQTATRLAAEVNHRVHATVAAHPDRFAGFATLPLTAPDAAAAELERAVGELGFVGTMISGNIAGRFLDDPDFAPVLETAARLDVPIYLHPGLVPQPVADAYYSGFSDAVNRTLGWGAYGWHYETSLHALRMIAGGVFDRLPGLKVILGHLGEGLPFHLARIEQQLGPLLGQQAKPVSACFRENFWFTTSAYPYDGPFRLAQETFGDDRLMFAVDYPFTGNEVVRDWFDRLDLTPAVREKIAHGTAHKLLGLH
jgi:uncharacterized protein